ncbi:class F sortase [Kineococcus sp. NUM-3379]
MEPVSLSIPAIGVETDLLHLGIAADGTLEVPALEQDDTAGWLASGPVPGEPGPAVLAGHVDSRRGPAVFFRLRELRPGDGVHVRRSDGTVVDFVVDAVRRVPKDAFPTAEVYGPVPGPALRLLTCGGRFDARSGHYTDNVVVFASAGA